MVQPCCLGMVHLFSCDVVHRIPVSYAVLFHTKLESIDTRLHQFAVTRRRCASFPNDDVRAVSVISPDFACPKDPHLHFMKYTASRR